MSKVDLLRTAYLEWHASRGANTAIWLSAIDDDVALRSIAEGAPGLEYAAARRGRKEIQEFFDALSSSWEMLHTTAEDFIEDADRVVVIGQHGWRNKMTNKAYHSTFAHVWRFRNGKVIEFYEFYDTATAIAAARPD